MKYECIKALRLSLFDEDGFDTDKYGYIRVGSVWETNNKANIIGGEIHLDKISGKSDYNWIEISEETLKESFRAVE